jgi:hypothetical protein
MAAIDSGSEKSLAARSFHQREIHADLVDPYTQVRRGLFICWMSVFPSAAILLFRCYNALFRTHVP